MVLASFTEKKNRSQKSTLWELFWKMVPFLVKKASKLFPFGKVPPSKGHRFPKKGTIFHKKVKNGALLENKALFLLQKKVENSALLEKGYHFGPLE